VLAEMRLNGLPLSQAQDISLISLGGVNLLGRVLYAN